MLSAKGFRATGCQVGQRQPVHATSTVNSSCRIPFGASEHTVQWRLLFQLLQGTPCNTHRRWRLGETMTTPTCLLILLLLFLVLLVLYIWSGQTAPCWTPIQWCLLHCRYLVRAEPTRSQKTCKLTLLNHPCLTRGGVLQPSEAVYRYRELLGQSWKDGFSFTGKNCMIRSIPEPETLRRSRTLYPRCGSAFLWIQISEAIGPGFLTRSPKP